MSHASRFWVLGEDAEGFELPLQDRRGVLSHASRFWV